MFLAIHQSTVSRVVKSVTDAIVRLVCPEEIRFPTTAQEIAQTKARFMDKYRMPGILGIVDGSHVALIGPPVQDPIHPEHVYVNRKGSHSVNAVLVNITHT